MRFQRARRLLCESAEPRWSMLAQAAGYFDQAHMIHEFRALCGQTPSALWTQKALAASKPRA